MEKRRELDFVKLNLGFYPFHTPIGNYFNL